MDWEAVVDDDVLPWKHAGSLVAPVGGHYSCYGWLASMVTAACQCQTRRSAIQLEVFQVL